MASHSLIHKKNIRLFLLDYAQRHRAHPFTRVAGPVYAQIEAVVREECRKLVQIQPSKGRTIR